MQGRFFFTYFLVFLFGTVQQSYGQTTINCDDFFITQGLNPGDYVIGAGVTQIKLRLRGGEGGNARLDGGTCDTRVRGGTGALVEVTFPVSDDMTNANSLKVGGIIRVYTGQPGQNRDRGCAPSPTGVYGGGGGASAIIYRDALVVANEWLVLATAGGGGGGSRPVANVFRNGKGGLAGVNGGSSGPQSGGVNGGCAGFSTNARVGASFLCDTAEGEGGRNMVAIGFGSIAQGTFLCRLEPPGQIAITGGTKGNRANGGNGFCGGAIGQTAGGGGGGASGGASSNTFSGGGGGSYVTSLRGRYDVNLVAGVDGASQNIPVAGFISIDARVPSASAVCPASVSLELNAAGQASLDPEALFEFPSDIICDATTTLFFVPAGFPIPIDLAPLNYAFDCPTTPGNVGSLRYLIQANDGSIASECTTSLTLSDNISPSASCQNTSVTLDNQGMATVLPTQISSGSSDNCAVTGLQLSQTAFTCADVGVNTVTLTVNDAGGNTDVCTATVTVEDSFVARCKNISYSVTANATPLTPADLDDGTFSNCFTIVDQQLSQTTFTCSGVETVTLTATNSVGQVRSCTSTVTITDAAAPTVVCKDFYTVTLDASGQASITPVELDNGSTDNCSASLSYIASRTNFGCSDVGAPALVDFSVLDAAGNLSTTCTVPVTVESPVSPTVVSCRPGIQVNLNADGQYPLQFSEVFTGTLDACSSGALLPDQSPLDCTNLGVNQVTATIQLADGTTESCTTTVIITDVTQPVANCIPNLSIDLDESGQFVLEPGMIDNGSTDNCTPQLQLSRTLLTCADVGEQTIRLTARDLSSNSSSCTTLVTVIDPNPPGDPCPIILPVEWLYFSAQATENASVQLSWATATEIDNDYFDIQHSTDGRQYTSIGQLPGAGNTTQTTRYEFVHQVPASGPNYYRIQQIDFDGKSSFSPVEVVSLASNDFSVFPNPARSEVTLSFQPLSAPTPLHILNSQGQLQATYVIDTDQRNFQLNCQDWPNGVYYLQLVSGNQRVVQRFVKMDGGG
ncbi:MAG: T9SS type A sorting domain-containing protein [Bacteroidota bacterium]